MQSEPSEEGYGCPLSQPFSCPCNHTFQTLQICVPFPSLEKSHLCVMLSYDLQIQVSWCAHVASLGPSTAHSVRENMGRARLEGWYLCHQFYTPHRFPLKLPKKHVHSARWALFFAQKQQSLVSYKEWHSSFFTSIPSITGVKNHLTLF